MSPINPGLRARTSCNGFYIGVDLGQKRDYTAIATVERLACVGLDRDRLTYQFPMFTRYHVRRIDRPPLGTSYMDIVDLIERHIQAAIPQFTHFSPRLVVDATGVGAPVVDLIQSRRFPCRLTPVTITAGDKEQSTKSGYYNVPKRNLVSGLQLIVEQGNLKASAAIPEAPVLVHEILNMRTKISAGAHESFEAWREGDHDDLVLAVALACWRAAKNWE